MVTPSEKKKTLTPSTLRIGRRYRPNRLEQDYDAIVIGSGIGGLTTAACLSRAGKKVLVLEQHYTAGGFTHAYSRNGYEWDVGIHYIGDVGTKKTTSRQLFDFISNGQLKWAAMDDNYDRFFFGEEQFDYIAGKDKFIASLKQRFPAEHDAIDEYMKRLSEVNKAMRWISMEKLADGLTGKLLKLIRKAKVPDYLNRTTYEVLKDLTDDELLIAVLTGQWGDCGVPPKESSFIIHSLIAKHYLHGGYYPVGGASKLAETIIPVIQQSGGEVFTYANVGEVLVKDNRAYGVQMVDGTRITAPAIISNAGVFNTFQRLLPQAVVKKHGYDQLLKKVKPSFSHLGLYIGIKESAEALGIPRTNFWIYPDTDHQQNIAAFKKDYQAKFPIVYISFPSAKDPSWESRYPNTSTIEIVAPADFSHFEQWKDEQWGKRGDEYDALKAYFTDRLLEHLYEKLPQLRGKVDYCELSTPLSTDFFCFYKRGEIYGLEHDPERFEQDWLRPKTKVKGLYLTGQDIMSCGVAGAMIGGFAASLNVLGLRSGLKLLKQFKNATYQEEAIVDTRAET
ncbi:FAD-dependent oxidoreductase [Endozoicomonas montiporae]|uniref:FAD-dependent oxidoreductase n=1 Tax=Endozoicomonas montiporae TaxID=1027273 RepID=A0A081N8C9_9GAMM|nr:FAD-dependent oxidoreductase [Endozoicomonas montiporae]